MKLHSWARWILASIQIVRIHGIHLWSLAIVDSFWLTFTSARLSVCVHAVCSSSRFWWEICSFLCRQVIIKSTLLIIHMFIFWRLFSTGFNVDMSSGHLTYFVATQHHSNTFRGPASARQKSGNDFLDQFLFCLN